MNISWRRDARISVPFPHTGPRLLLEGQKLTSPEESSGNMRQGGVEWGLTSEKIKGWPFSSIACFIFSMEDCGTVVQGRGLNPPKIYLLGHECKWCGMFVKWKRYPSFVLHTVTVSPLLSHFLWKGWDSDVRLLQLLIESVPKMQIRQLMPCIDVSISYEYPTTLLAGPFVLRLIVQIPQRIALSENFS